MLLEGARRLGYAARPVPQNIRGPLAAHAECGAHCTIGCRGEAGDGGEEGSKMSGCRAFLAPAIAQGERSEGPAVKVITGFEVERVLWDDEDEQRASGVVGWYTGPREGERKRLVVRAEMVVLAAGTMHTPAILMRSGVQVSLTFHLSTFHPHPSVGKHGAVS
jgi:choline dehydrogenase-like flavoprotein